ncbi:sulfatase [Maribacter sp. 2210JD10-5]|uniref:sulfatase family protein n=1 Tax=Maribacter sp. 2210JD10-5 TaxID=3386272 RepID=UPI0039BCFAF9
MTFTNRVIILLLWASFFSCQKEQKEVAKKPNILLIVVDDLGYADFKPFQQQGQKAVTPNMARLADAGTVYTQAYVTAPVCSPSRAGLITGKNQFRWDKPASWGPGLPDSVKTIAEYLKTAGYTTARIGKNDLGQKFHRNDVREFPLHHGYDEFLGFSAHAHDYWLNSTAIEKRTPDPKGTSALLGPLMHNMGKKSYEEGYLTEIFTDEAVDYIKRKKDTSFFLTLSYNAVHHLIHEVPKKYLDKYDVPEIPNYDPDSLLTYKNHDAGSYAAYYDKYSRIGAIQSPEMRNYYLANLNCLDDNLGRVLDALKEERIDDETIIFFISDNGGSPLTGSDNSPLTAGKYSLWEGGIRVPMIMVWPGTTVPGTIENAYVSAMDILPTIAKASNFTIEDTEIDGIDLRQPNPDRLLVWKWQKTWAARKGNWKLTNAKENHWKSEPSEYYIKPIIDDLSLKLFDLSKDPGERNNLANEYPEKVKALEDLYIQWCAEHIE